MAFPYPENPNDWQTAYTRDHAHQDSDKYGNNFILPIVFCFLILLAYVCLHTMPFSFFKIYSPLIRVGLTIAILLIFFLLFTIIAFLPAIRFASKFFIEFYCPPYEMRDPSKIINYRLFGISKLPPPLNMFSQFSYIIVKNGEIEKKDKWPAWSARNLGGPLTLIVFDGNALYLERGNRFSRVVGPGEKIPFLEWYETIKYVVDLHPKVKTDKFDVWTKDGIKIKMEVQIECRIGDPSKNDPANGVIYPYDPVAIKKAVERFSLRWPNRQEGEPSEFTWIDAAWGQVTGIVPGYIGSRTLDDLFIADRKSGQILSPESIGEVKVKLNSATQAFGVFITDFQILKVDMPTEVYAHQKDQWKTERQSLVTIIEGQTKAFHIRSREKARADAQRDLIISIADGLKKNKSGQYTEPLLLSLSGILDNSLRDPLMRAYLANSTLETLEKIKTMLVDKPSQLQ
jgi:regulator of protease activity HflC (stomatin/prohibitin superfamily)